MKSIFVEFLLAYKCFVFLYRTVALIELCYHYLVPSEINFFYFIYFFCTILRFLIILFLYFNMSKHISVILRGFSRGAKTGRLNYKDTEPYMFAFL
jgi:hypothetical protein